MPGLPFIVDVKRHSLEDGPGIRSVVFFKGCPLRCVFCQNPEAQNACAEIAFRAERCVDCGACVSVCLRRAVDRTGRGRLDRSLCDGCGKCAHVCPSSALAVVGQPYEVGELVELLMRDEPFYRHSGGGVTFSGGECTMFPDYLWAVAFALKARGLHTAVETCGEFAPAVFVERLLPVLDLVYFDLKFADPLLHLAHTGRDNHRILDNLALLMRTAPDRVHVRIPLVPGITATEKNLAGLAASLRELGVRQAILLPYNPLGRRMAVALGHPQSPVSERFMTKEEQTAAIAMFKAVRAITWPAPSPGPLLAKLPAGT
jgi:pyruvate formate lyase activating enzyme